MLNSSQIIFSMNLYPKGLIEFGYPEKITGMSVGTSGIIARILIPKDCGNYPDTWFPLRGTKSLTKIKKEMLDNSIKDLDGLERSFIPQAILLDCYQYAWEVIYYSKLNKNEDANV